MPPNNLGSSTLVLSATSVDSENHTDQINQNVVDVMNSTSIESTDRNVSLTMKKRKT